MSRLLLFLVFFPLMAGAQVARLYDSGVALFNKKDYKGAKLIMTRVIAKSPYYFEAYTFRGRAYTELGMADSAVADFNTALSKNPDFLPALYYRGVLYFNQGEYRQAINDFDAVIIRKPRFIRALIYRGRCREALGDEEQAIADYTRAINMNLKNAEVLFRRAMLYERKHQPKSAIWDYSQCIKINPSYVPALLHRAKMYLMRDKKEEALADLNALLNLTDTVMEAYRLRGDLRYEAKNYKGAAEDYTVVIQKFRVRDTGLYFQRAEAYYRDSNYSLAYKEYSRVLKVKPRDADAVAGQARVNMQRGKINSAVALLHKALAFDAGHSEANFLMGKIAYQKEDFDKALAYFNTALKRSEMPEAYFLRGSCKVELGDKYGACLDLRKAQNLGYEHPEMAKALRLTCQ